MAARNAQLRGHGRASGGRAFTLVELLVCVAVLALLVGLLLPALRGGRESARLGVCLSNQRQLTLAWSMYAGDFGGRAMPLSDLLPGGSPAAIDATYWWGRVETAGGAGGGPCVNHGAGFIAPYLAARLHERSVFECPSQRWGTYRAQPLAIPAPGVPTSTYGYNGYYLTPVATPGWNLSIGRQAWKRLEDIERPTDVFVFTDALLPTSPVRNTALLDPPMLFEAGAWTVNPAPTTAFRHRGGGHGAAGTARADGGARAAAARPEWLTHAAIGVGSVGTANGPHYVPDWERWR